MITIENYFDRIEDRIKYSDDYKQPYTAVKIVNNLYNTVLDTGLYTDSRKIWCKKASSDKMWENFNNLFAEEYCNLREL